MQIERFLGKEVEKLPLPDGMGEGPEYKSSAKEGKSAQGRSRHRSGRKGRGGSHGKGRKDKGQDGKKNSKENKPQPNNQ